MSHDMNEQEEKIPLPEHRRKLYVLATLAGIVILLLWIWTLPLNFHGKDGGGSPRDLFGPIGDTVQEGRDRIPSRDTNQ